MKIVPLSAKGLQPQAAMAKLPVDDALLVSLVQMNRGLYDRQDPGYKDAAKKDHAWSAIAKALNLPKVVCKTRWTIIRQRYSRLRKTHTPQQIQEKLQSPENLNIDHINNLLNANKRSSHATSRRSAWKLFESLDFLNSHIQRRNCPRDSKKATNRDDDDAMMETADVKPDRNSLEPPPPIECSDDEDRLPRDRSEQKSDKDKNNRQSRNRRSPFSYSNSPPPTPTPTPDHAGSDSYDSCALTPVGAVAKKGDGSSFFARLMMDGLQVSRGRSGGSRGGESGGGSFGEFVSFELAGFKNELNKDVAKQRIVNVIYALKNETKNVQL